eukprot:scaffold1102_cov256-Pinguiococcus_pyrenoidosus.AAC.24
MLKAVTVPRTFSPETVTSPAGKFPRESKACEVSHRIRNWVMADPPLKSGGPKRMATEAGEATVALGADCASSRKTSPGAKSGIWYDSAGAGTSTNCGSEFTGIAALATSGFTADWGLPKLQTISDVETLMSPAVNTSLPTIEVKTIVHVLVLPPATSETTTRRVQPWLHGEGVPGGVERHGEGSAGGAARVVALHSDGDRFHSVGAPWRQAPLHQILGDGVSAVAVEIGTADNGHRPADHEARADLFAGALTAQLREGRLKGRVRLNHGLDGHRASELSIPRGGVRGSSDVVGRPHGQRRNLLRCDRRGARRNVDATDRRAEGGIDVPLQKVLPDRVPSCVGRICK